MAKWDLSKLPEGRKPLPDEWFRERAQMQERIAVLEAERAKAELHWQSSQRIGEAMYRLHKLKHWLDMDQELFDVMTDQQQADHKYVQTAVDGIIWALKEEKPTS